jgi:trimethylamine---corrinoid protein Co-methyltransferase
MRSGRSRTQQKAQQKRRRIEPPLGGQYRPLSSSEAHNIIDTAFAILEQIGMADTPEPYRTKLLETGKAHEKNGRLCFSKTALEDAVARAAKQVVLPGFDDDKSIEVGGGKVHIGTGGAAVQILLSEDGSYRESRLNDLFDLMRLVDVSEAIHYGLRPVVACDMATPYDLDINTAFACLKATTKPIGVSFSEPEHLAKSVEMFDAVLGEKTFNQQPFCFGVIVHVVPPLRYAPEGTAVMLEAMKHGMPLQICSAGQAGATSPASLAGALAQGLAESLAGLLLVDTIQPGYPCIFAFMPFISDLRTGAMSGGSGESAVANAAAAQLLLQLGLPSTVSAGMTDAKFPDAQAGFEKGYTVSMAAQAGADMINLSVGMLGSIMIASREALVIDNEMCSAILRSVKGIEVNSGRLDLDIIEKVVRGEGHYLGEDQTLDLMKTEYVYPNLSDRKGLEDWQMEGSLTIWDRAKVRVKEILAGPYASHLPKDVEQKIRQKLPIKLGE